MGIERIGDSWIVEGDMFKVKVYKNGHMRGKGSRIYREAIKRLIKIMEE